MGVGGEQFWLRVRSPRQEWSALGDQRKLSSSGSDDDLV